jgi:uncharacterized protein YkwD
MKEQRRVHMFVIRLRSRAAWLLAAAGVAVATTLLAGAGQAEAGLMAPRSDCHGQANHKAPEPQQEDAMRCLINYARQQAGARGIGTSRKLERAAGAKVADVLDCGLSHTACGKPAFYYPERFGYTRGSWGLGENLASGRGKRGTARKVMKLWLNSAPHADTMLGGSFDDLGLGLRRGTWVLVVGCHGC